MKKNDIFHIILSKNTYQCARKKQTRWVMLIGKDEITLIYTTN